MVPPKPTETSPWFYLTTPIYYASDRPHLGHAYTTIIGDALCRYQRIQKRPKEQVFYLTGTDEHGEKIERAAQAKGMAPQAFVDEVAESYKALWKTLHIQYDDFIRTTEPRHTQVVQRLWTQLVEQGDIYQGEYEGWYCVPCESFYPEKDLLPGLLCPDHKRPVEKVKERGYFFRLSKYESALLEHYKNHPDFIQPAFRKNEVAAFVAGGLKDLSISRSSFSWGIPVPNDPKQVIYVWIDALTNYYSAMQEPFERQNVWGTTKRPTAIHLVGKEILRFHAVYWPALLLALKLPLPKHIIAHGWWTVDGEKMSKTVGNVVNPAVLAKDLGADALRYYVLREVPVGQDGDFSYQGLLNRYHSELGNDLGNLLHRTLSMVEKFSEGKAQQRTKPPVVQGEPTDLYESLQAKAAKTRDRVEAAMEAFQPAEALTALFDLVREANAYLEHTAPFKLAKIQPDAAKHVLYQVLETLRWLGMMLDPFLPEKAYELRRQLGLSHPEIVTWPKAWGELAEGTPVQKGNPLFPRIEETDQLRFLADWQKKTPPAPERLSTNPLPSVPQTPALLPITEWQKWDLRIATVAQAERIPKKDKLLQLTIDVGDGLRTVVAGLGAVYTPEQLVGKQVVLVANLQPAKIGGVLSQGMVLAVGADQIRGLLQPTAEVPSGTPVK